MIGAGLAVELGGLRLRNPVVCAAGEHVMSAAALRGALAAGAAAVVAKSANDSVAARRQLAAAAYAVLDADWTALPDGDAGRPGASLLNRSGLVDVGFDDWARLLAEVDCEAAAEGAWVVGSVLPETPEQAPRLAARMEAAGLRWIELNLSAPHATEAGDRLLRVDSPAGVHEIVTAVRGAVDVPLTVKLTSEASDVVALADAAHGAGADVVCLCGRRMGFLPDVHGDAPVLGTFGAIGGSWELPLTARWIAKTRQRLGPGVAIAGTGGARSGLDVARLLLAGASAVQLASVVRGGGFGALRDAIAELEAHLAARGVAAADLIGRAADAALSYDEAASAST